MTSLYNKSSHKHVTTYKNSRIRDEHYYYWEDSCIPALEKICTGIEDLKYWLKLLELTDSIYEDGNEDSIALMQTYARKKIGEESQRIFTRTIISEVVTYVLNIFRFWQSQILTKQNRWPRRVVISSDDG